MAVAERGGGERRSLLLLGEEEGADRGAFGKGRRLSELLGEREELYFQGGREGEWRLLGEGEEVVLVAVAVREGEGGGGGGAGRWRRWQRRWCWWRSAMREGKRAVAVSGEERGKMEWRVAAAGRIGEEREKDGDGGGGWEKRGRERGRRWRYWEMGRGVLGEESAREFERLRERDERRGRAGERDEQKEKVGGWEEKRERGGLLAGGRRREEGEERERGREATGWRREGDGGGWEEKREWGTPAGGRRRRRERGRECEGD